MSKVLIGSVVVILLAVSGIFFLLRGDGSTSPIDPNGQTHVSVVDGKQVIEITAKGGYAPRVTVAKANTPTVINVQTNGTFDCSSALTVPASGYRTMLPSSGITPIEIPPQQPGTTIKGVCSMGMYNFAVNFN